MSRYVMISLPKRFEHYAIFLLTIIKKGLTVMTMRVSMRYYSTFQQADCCLFNVILSFAKRIRRDNCVPMRAL